MYNYDISERLKNILNHQKIVSIEEMSNYNRKQASNFRNAGKKSIEELEELMSKYGVQFKDTNQ
ncbi:DNA-directed RNA polymerase subunit alpha C-terminal domain-containing protein [Bacteroidota bacterium]